MPTFEIRRNPIDVTCTSYVDEKWSYRDKQGHVHRYGKNESLPTLKQIIDYPGDDEYPSVSHYECRKCGARVEPGTRAATERQFVAGLTEYLIDGISVSQEEFERRVKEERKNL